MIFWQLTPARMRRLDTLWGSIIQRYRGPIPRSLALAHMLAETNGQENPPQRDVKKRPVGLMHLSLRDANAWGYTEETLTQGPFNIYLWCKKTNQDAEYIHRTFTAWWTQATLDFWLALRAGFILGLSTLTNLFQTAAQEGSTYQSTAGVVQWIRTRLDKTKRFETFAYRHLQQLADHLDSVRVHMTHFGDATAPSTAFYASAAPTPQPLITARALHTR